MISLCRCSLVLLFSLVVHGVQAQPVFEYLAEDIPVHFELGQTDVIFERSVFCRETTLQPVNRCQGFVVSVAHDPDALEVLEIDFGPLVLAQHPFIHNGTVHDGGWTAFVFYDPTESILIQDEFIEFVRVTYRVVEGFLPQAGAVSTSLTFSDELGDPVAINGVLISGISYGPVFEDGEIVIEGFENALFQRGDCNQDAALDLTDCFAILGYLFGGAPVPGCLATCDADASVSLDLVDALYVLTHLVLGGPPPTEPFPLCGGDDSGFSCDLYDACP